MQQASRRDDHHCSSRKRQRERILHSHGSISNSSSGTTVAMASAKPPFTAACHYAPELIHPKMVGRFVPRPRGESETSNKHVSSSRIAAPEVAPYCVTGTGLKPNPSTTSSKTPNPSAAGSVAKAAPGVLHTTTAAITKSSNMTLSSTVVSMHHTLLLSQGASTPDLTEASTSTSETVVEHSQEQPADSSWTAESPKLTVVDGTTASFPVQNTAPVRTTGSAEKIMYPAPVPTVNDKVVAEAVAVAVSKPRAAVTTNIDKNDTVHNVAAAPDASSTDLDDIQVGTRVAVYWDGEDAFFEGTITQERLGRQRRFFLKYDDGDREWIDFSRHTFRIIDTKKAPACQEGNTKIQEENPSAELSDGSEVKRKKKRKGKSMAGRYKTSIVAKAVTTKNCAGDGSGDKHQDNWVAAGCQREANASSDSETDEEEIMQWAQKMFGVSAPQRPIARPKKAPSEPEFDWDAYSFADVHVPISEKVKLGRRKSRCGSSSVTVEEPKPKKKKRKVIAVEDLESALDKAAAEESKRKKQEARALTVGEIRSILGEDFTNDDGSHWVRRSVRQPSKSVLNSPQVKALFDKLRSNDTDMVVLKMKKYLNDPNAPSIILDAVLDALEENTNCEALYIQNFNEGMRDEQILRLMKVLQRPACKIWCLNIGETYKVMSETWEMFADGLRDTKITHMYASEHTIDPELKEQIRATIRKNRSKHSMHVDPENLDTILQCTHCWWNPINAKALRPYIRGCEHLLHDAEAQGLAGTMSADNIL